MQFAILGPLKVLDGGQDRTPGRAKQLALLAALLLHPNEVVASDRLVEALWGEAPPATAPNALHGHVSALRKLLGAERIETHRTGYRLRLDPEELDLARFEALVAEARGEAEPAARSGRLREALALWRGDPLADLGYESFAQAEIRRLEELHVAVLEDRIEADLQLGRHGDLPAELEALVQRHPQRERLRGQYMLALYRCGRQADALASYREGRRVLDQELGLQPSRPLRDLEERILRQDPALAVPLQSAPSMPPSPIPRAHAVTRYATNGDLSLAYQVFGEGKLELMLITGWVLPMELAWDEPVYARFLERLGSFGRVLLWDKRGTGLSDRIAPGELPTVEERMTDLTAVIDAAGFARPAIVGLSEGSVLACMFAATHPERTRALAVYGGWARTIATPDYPWGATPQQHQRLLARVRRHWGDAGPLLRYWAPESQDDERLRAWWARALRLGASPTAAVRWLQMMVDFDIRAVLPSIRVPTLVMHRSGDVIVPVGNGRYLAEHIPDADYVELPGSNHLWWLGDHEQLLEPLDRFLIGAAPARIPDRILTTVLSSDIADSTRGASEIGERRWRDLLAQHDHVVRSNLQRSGGRPIKTTGRGFQACFDGPTRAVHCAVAMRGTVAELGLDLRIGLHTGECELLGDDITGIAVNIAARACALARPGEILVSRTVTDLVAGSGLRFQPRGEHKFAVLPGTFPLLAVTP